jgi:hypothetical protein
VSALAVVLLVLQTGCGRMMSGPSADEFIAITFANESRDHADIWVVAPDIPAKRVGTVLEGETARLRVPRLYFSKGQINFYANLRGRDNVPGTDWFAARAGEKLRLRLPVDMKEIQVVR